MNDLFVWVVFGLTTGAIYAVAASGLVLTYTTSGIFNFAHGAVGMLAAFAYWQVRIDLGWPAPLALGVILVVLAPLLGAVVERVILRGLSGASEVTRTVVTVGLLVGFIGLAQVLWKPETRLLPRFFGDDATLTLPTDVVITWHDLIGLLCAGVVAGALTLLLRGTRIGIAMRAVVDNRALAQLNGAQPGQTSMLSWALGFSLAALAGVLIGPILFLDITVLTFLVINAYAAAMVGRLTSLPLTFVGGLAIGVAETIIVGLLDPARFPVLENWSSWTVPLRGVVPVVILFVLLLVLPTERAGGHAVTRVRERVPRPAWRTSLIAAAALVVGVAVLLPLIGDDPTYLGTLSKALAFGVIILSLVPLVGYGGQISLAQMGLAGIGAIVMSKWGVGGPLEDLLGLVAAFVVAACVGAIVALPALRLKGIYLALATFAFAVFLDKMVFVQDFAFKGSSLQIERFELLGMSLQSDRAYTLFLAIMFAVCGLGVVALRRGPFGRRLQAMKDSPAACATLGIDLTRTKLAVFAVSAGLAGLGGALLGGQKTAVAAIDFDPVQGLVVLLMAVAGGIAMVAGALVGGVLFASLGFWVEIAPEEMKGFVENLVLLAPGLIGISLGRNPNGLVAQVSDAASRQRELWASRSERRAGAADGPAWDLETLGIDRPFTADDLEVIDATLEIDGVTNRWARARGMVVGTSPGVPS
jgi:branched-chain amino acid transport system permease protein